LSKPPHSSFFITTLPQNKGYILNRSDILDIGNKNIVSFHIEFMPAIHSPNYYTSFIIKWRQSVKILTDLESSYHCVNTCISFFVIMSSNNVKMLLDLESTNQGLSHELLRDMVQLIPKFDRRVHHFRPWCKPWRSRPTGLQNYSAESLSWFCPILTLTFDIDPGHLVWWLLSL
jgi:hypothetical protein